MPGQDPIKAAADALSEDTPTQIAGGGDYLTDDEVEQFNRNPGAHGARAKIEGKVAERRAAGQKMHRT